MHKFYQEYKIKNTPTYKFTKYYAKKILGGKQFCQASEKMSNTERFIIVVFPAPETTFKASNLSKNQEINEDLFPYQIWKKKKIRYF